jgi:hypothetical protein
VSVVVSGFVNGRGRLAIEGLGWGLVLLLPGLVVSALLAHVGATPWERYLAQFASTVAFLLIVARHQRRARLDQDRREGEP